MKKTKNTRLFLLPFLLAVCVLLTTFHSPKAISSNKNCHCLSIEELDFHRWTIGSEPMMSFFLFNHDGKLLSSMIPSADWIKTMETSYENDLKEVIVKLDITNLSPGLYQEKLEFVSDSCSYVLPIRLDLVKRKTIVQMAFDIPSVSVNGKAFPQNAAPFIRKGYTYIPIRATCEAFGATVDYKKEDNARVILIKYQDQVMELPFNSAFKVINGRKLIMVDEIQVRTNTAFMSLLDLQSFLNFSSQLNEQYRLITLVN